MPRLLRWILPLACAGLLAGLGRGIGGEPTVWNVAEYGALGDGATLNTSALQRTIDECAARGGGTVVIPPGTFLSGALFLKPGVSLTLQEGATLKGSTNIEDYPKLPTRIEGHFEPWRAALLNADGANGLRLSGPGTLDGSGAPFWAEFWRRRKLDPKVTNLAVERPRLVLIQNSERVTVRDVRFKDSGFWNLHLYRSRHVEIAGCRFQAPHGPPPDHAASSDGIDVDSSQDVQISHCAFSVGDDCVALKGSKGPFAARDEASLPVERVRISDCTFEAGGAVVTFGSEATLVRDVEVARCRVGGGVPILRLKLRPDTEQRYEDVRCHDLTGDGAGDVFEVAPWKQFFDLKGQPPPGRVVRNVTISHVRGSFRSLGRIVGNLGDVIENVRLEDADLEVRREELEAQPIKQLGFVSVRINGKAVTAADVSRQPAGAATPEVWNTF